MFVLTVAGQNAKLRPFRAKKETRETLDIKFIIIMMYNGN